MAKPSQAFAVHQILSDKIEWGNTYYLIRWEVTVTRNIQPFLERYQAEIKNVLVMNGVHKIVWKDTWMPATALKDTCDELMGAYLLLKMYKCRLHA